MPELPASQFFEHPTQRIFRQEFMQIPFRTSEIHHQLLWKTIQLQKLPEKTFLAPIFFFLYSL